MEGNVHLYEPFIKRRKAFLKAIGAINYLEIFRENGRLIVYGGRYIALIGVFRTSTWL